MDLVVQVCALRRPTSRWHFSLKLLLSNAKKDRQEEDGGLKIQTQGRVPTRTMDTCEVPFWGGNIPLPTHTQY